MKTKKINLFIVEGNLLAGMSLEDFLIKRFGDKVRISNFLGVESCLEKIDDKTDLVILNHSSVGKPGTDILKLIKDINPGIEVILLSAHEDVALAIESYRAGVTETIVNGISSRKKISVHVKRILMAPIRIIVKELGLSQRLAMFVVSFVTVGIVVLCVLQFVK